MNGGMVRQPIGLSRALRYKLTPPELPSDLLDRAALRDRLTQAFRRRVTLVVAGAGFGKSTVLATMALAAGWAWYTLELGDEELWSLASGIVAAVSLRLPHVELPAFAQPLQSLVPHVDQRTHAEALAEQLSESLGQNLTDDLVLVLDDVHELQPEGPSSHLVEWLVRTAPPNLHLVLSSRSDPPFPISRLRGRGEVMDIGPAELSFSEDEITELFGKILGPGNEPLALHLYRATGGWPAAIRLAMEAMAGTPESELPARIEALRTPEGPLFSYMADEVFSGEGSLTTNVLRTAAQFDRCTADLLEQLGAAGAATVLAGLAHRGVMVQSHSGAGGWFTIHALAREFARERWPIDAAELSSMRGRAAEWFSAHGHDEAALRSLEEAEDPDALARFLVDRGDALLASGVVQAVIHAAWAVPARKRSSALEEIAGQAHALRGDLSTALECFHRAVGDEGAIRPGLAWRMVMAHYFRDDLEAALAVFARTQRDQIKGDSSADRQREEAMLLAWVAGVHMRLGDMESCRALADQALKAARASGHPQALAAAHASLALAEQGAAATTASEEHLRSALEAAEQAHDVIQMVRIRNNLGSVLLESCRFGEARQTLDEAVAQAELVGYAKMQALALFNRGLANWGLGHLDEAAVDYGAALALYRKSGSLEACYALTGLGDIYRERGDLALARASYEEALPLAERSGDRQGIVPALYQQARTLIDEDPDRALLLAERAASYGWPDHAWALNTVAWIQLAKGDREHALEAAVQAGAEALERHDYWGLGESLTAQGFCATDRGSRGGLLREALAVYRQIGSEVRRAEVQLALARVEGSADAAEDAERRLRELGVHHSAARAAGVLWALAREEAEPVAIQTLGAFTVVREGMPVTRRAWRSKKAQQLLKILVARRGQPTPRELLMETLWPDEEEEKLPHRLSVALTTVRSVLDPDRRFESDRYVSGDDVTIWLEAEHLSIDVVRLFDQARAGLTLRERGRKAEARELLESAEALYGGEFLEEDLYEDWAVGVREEARALYICVARSLAEDRAASGDRDAAARYLLRLLERDPYDEDAHVLLVRTLEEAGQRGEARRRYCTYVERMTDIDVEAAPFPVPAAATR